MSPYLALEVFSPKSFFNNRTSAAVSATGSDDVWYERLLSLVPSVSFFFYSDMKDTKTRYRSISLQRRIQDLKKEDTSPLLPQATVESSSFFRMIHNTQCFPPKHETRVLLKKEKWYWRLDVDQRRSTQFKVPSKTHWKYKLLIQPSGIQWSTFFLHQCDGEGWTTVFGSEKQRRCAVMVLTG